MYYLLSCFLAYLDLTPRLLFYPVIYDSYFFEMSMLLLPDMIVFPFLLQLDRTLGFIFKPVYYELDRPLSGDAASYGISMFFIV